MPAKEIRELFLRLLEDHESGTLPVEFTLYDVVALPGEKGAASLRCFRSLTEMDKRSVALAGWRNAEEAAGSTRPWWNAFSAT